MNKPLAVKSERVDDIPLLLAQLERMGIQELLDKYFPTHGNWKGLSLGWCAIVWLSYIISQADHRLSYVQDWVDKRQKTLALCTTQALKPLDFSDDRLEAILRYLSDDETWQEFETELGGSLVRVYDLQKENIRLDSTTASGYCGITEDGLFQWGHTKDYRPDLAQVKIMLATIDPLGMPIASEVVAGNSADDPLYIPAIDRVRDTLSNRGHLYIGDCKMAAKATRAHLAAGNDYYLCPLSATQLDNEQLKSLLEPVWNEKQKLITPRLRHEERSDDLDYNYANGKTEEIAVGYECSRTCKTSINGFEYSWSERMFVVRSLKSAVSSEKSLRTRLTKAEAALSELGKPCRGKKKLLSQADWLEAVEGILLKYRVQGLFNLDYQVITEPRLKRAYRDRPAKIVKESHCELKFSLNTEVIEKKIAMFGWRVYASNHPETGLSLADAVVAYRDEYSIERGFGRLKGFPLSLTPIYLQREDHIKGLIRLLSIGLRLLTLLEFQLRRSLSSSNKKISGLYAGNPKRKTSRPTAEQLLQAFKEINSIAVTVGSQVYFQIGQLSPLQQEILNRLEIPEEIYTQLVGEFCLVS